MGVLCLGAIGGVDLAPAQEASCSGLSQTAVSYPKWHHLQTVFQAIASCSPGRCRELLPSQLLRTSQGSRVEASAVFLSPTASLTSCSGSNRWWSAGSPFQQVLSLRFSSCPPGRRLQLRPNLAFLLKRVSWGKEKETERSWCVQGDREELRAWGRGRWAREAFKGN